MDAAEASAAPSHAESHRAWGETSADTWVRSLAEAKEEIKAELRENELAAVWTQISALRAELQALREGKTQTHAREGGGDAKDSNSSTLLPVPPPRPSLLSSPAPPEHLLPPEESPKREGGDENEEEDEVELEGSMWYSPMLVFTPVCGAGASTVCIFLLVINLAVQGMFCYIVMQALSVANITPDTVEGLKSWRRSSAHDYANYNTVRGQSMAARVCAQDTALDMSASQTTMYASLKAYIGEGNA